MSGEQAAGHQPLNAALDHSSAASSSGLRVKICCIKSIEEARLAISLGANLLGLVSRMPSGVGQIDDHEIATIAGQVGPGIETVLLTSRTAAAEVAEQHRSCRTTAIQLVDDAELVNFDDLRSLVPEVKLIQVFHVTDQRSVDRAIQTAPQVDAILLDSGNPNAAIRELGGTGRVHDWNLSKVIVDAVDQPVFLAGGLSAQNVGEAIAKVQPAGVDLCSSVRTNDQLNPDKLTSFFDAFNGATQRKEHDPDQL